MSKFKLKFVLIVFNGLIGLKRALALLFLGFGSVLEGLGRFLARFLFFPFYKFYLAMGRKMKWGEGGKLARRSLLYLLILILVLILVSGETSAYADNQYLSGRYSLLYEYLGPGEEGEIFEEGLEDSARPAPAAVWSQGSLSPSPPLAGPAAGPEELGGLALGQTTLAPPMILPGADIGTGRYKIVQYVVQPGDTVSSLAQKFQISAETILIENKLSVRSLLRPGDVLSVLPVSGVSHKVKKGETLKKLASVYRANLQKIIDFNHLTEDVLPAGEILIIPEGRQPPPPVSYQPAAAGRPPALKVVRAGMLWPTVARRITQYFNWRHPGIDVALPTGNPIYAAESGTVEIAGWNRGGYGYQVIINHGNNLKTRYAHASKLFVRAGQAVEKGEVIALIGSTGRSTGPHLHFEIIVGGVRVNPFMYVR